MSVRLRIIAAMQQIAKEQQVTLPPLDDNLSLHETGFDSLGFAILVARLEDDLGARARHVEHGLGEMLTAFSARLPAGNFTLTSLTFCAGAPSPVSPGIVGKVMSVVRSGWPPASTTTRGGT